MLNNPLFVSITFSILAIATYELKGLTKKQHRGLYYIALVYGFLLHFSFQEDFSDILLNLLILAIALGWIQYRKYSRRRA